MIRIFIFLFGVTLLGSCVRLFVPEESSATSVDQTPTFTNSAPIFYLTTNAYSYTTNYYVVAEIMFTNTSTKLVYLNCLLVLSSNGRQIGYGPFFFGGSSSTALGPNLSITGTTTLYYVSNMNHFNSYSLNF